MPAPTFILIVATSDPELVGDVLDLVTGKTAAALAGLKMQTESVLEHAQAISTDAPIHE